LISSSQRIKPVSVLAVLLAAVCFAIALLLLNRVQKEHPLIVARNVLTMASIQLIIVALITTTRMTYKAPSPSIFIAVIYLGV
ncbi:EamA/RhaT family transporter, partial [Vibrio anguillarum]|nr:EamA/RhaT family transporter [Vibrio anguillarum]